MALAVLDNIKKRVVRILNANPSAWTTTVSGESGAFPDNDEITAAILEADEMIVTKGYFQSVNPTLAQSFMVMGTNIASGAKVPFHYGKRYGKVELSADSGFSPAVVGTEANSRDDITAIMALGSSYVQSGAFDHLYFIDGNGVFYHPATYGRLELPSFTRTSALQSFQSEESLIIATAVRLLTKHATPALFDAWTKESVAGINQLVTDGFYKAKEE